MPATPRPPPPQQQRGPLPAPPPAGPPPALPRRAAIGGLLAAAAAPWCCAPPRPAAARIATERLEQRPDPQRPVAAAGFDPSQTAAARAEGRPPAPGEPSVRGARERAAIQDALARLELARRAAAEARWEDALAGYSGLVDRYPDLALATYGRLGKAVMSYQLGDVSTAIIVLDELEVEERGIPEVHAALAAVLWAERPRQRLRAEQQFELAAEFDRRYSDVTFVREQRHWPPRLVAALEQFQRMS
ncbi:hypothetical protein Rsub_08766 [Raphidocelis subcapitata]|uniref:Tetratricopeptide repeat protein n=1 Tax=Raphidocelis subcapitata TaxID=307507 RepID=A0A2V0P8N0_9CHLO|nr:hypothetical protein Rsub_08766 [Raphidocelis subcapitata]|eukprot:GBF96221.1 hypothetical protein Rsub_08766 [Raphidocelis subcapitata]